MSDSFYSPADFTPQRSIGYLVHRLKKLGTARAEAMFAHLDISFVQWVTLSQVRHGLATNAAEIARCLGHNSGAVTRMLDQLDQRGLIRRIRDAGDRRIVNLETTDAGDMMLDRLTPKVIDLWNHYLSILTRDEAETLIATLQRLLAVAEAEEEEA